MIDEVGRFYLSRRTTCDSPAEGRVSRKLGCNPT